jgi:putative DNA methylase
MQTTWYTKDQAVKGLPQQALPMTWDYCEANPFGESSANFVRCADVAAECVAAAPALGCSTIEQRPAQELAKGFALDIPHLSARAR